MILAYKFNDKMRNSKKILVSLHNKLQVVNDLWLETSDEWLVTCDERT
jgi:hypothetical protein